MEHVWDYVDGFISGPGGVFGETRLEGKEGGMIKITFWFWKNILFAEDFTREKKNSKNTG